MKVVLRVLGWLLLIVTIGLASCQALLKAEPLAEASASDRSGSVSSLALVAVQQHGF